ncbi:GntR family transcriptional regulator [Microbacterium sp. SLBN-154]|uniref:GntR family transcriptional regulator n=1 Tax=Microbacterium sp. SLBN-154 TaxID=2768458 RepID=UPI001153A411|nr:GntR family transcriptional regulator [Microbacterium sp. SLBN-154]TQK17719.1 GntR family transcriptional regulator [Microbacterium sp. SLBN-154]
MTESVPKIGRTDAAYEALRAKILRNDIRPGEHVKIEQVARELNISQTPVREALARLEADGLLAKTRFRGYTATPILSDAEFEQLFEFRQLIEPWAAGHAARNAGPSSSALSDELDRIAGEVRGVGADIERERPDEVYSLLSDHDVRFHALVSQLSGNRHVADSYDAMHCHMHLFRNYLAARAAVAAEGPDELARFDGQYTTQRAALETTNEHRAISAAIIAGDEERAAREMRAHVSRAEGLARVRMAIVAAATRAD